MFNTTTNNANVDVRNEIAFNDKYPSIDYYVKTVEVTDVGEELCWLKDSHKKVTLNGNEFIAVIHKGMAGLIKERTLYTIQYDHPDKRFDRYIEIVRVQQHF